MADIVASSSSRLPELVFRIAPAASPVRAASPSSAPQPRPAAGPRAVSNIALYAPSFVPQYDPLSPYANAQGLVSSANIDVRGASLGEILALRSYRANLATLRTADELKTIDLVS